MSSIVEASALRETVATLNSRIAALEAEIAELKGGMVNDRQRLFYFESECNALTARLADAEATLRRARLAFMQGLTARAIDAYFASTTQLKPKASP